MRTAQEAMFDAMVNSAWASDESGNVEAPTGHFAVLRLSEKEYLYALREFASVIAVYGEPAPSDVVGNWLVITDSLGFIDIERYDTPEQLYGAYASLESEYADWGIDS